VEDVVLKTSFGTSYTLKDVMYIPSLKRKLISVGQLDEEGYHLGFRDQEWKVTKGSFVVAHGNKRGSLYMVEVVWEAEEAFLHNISEDKETAEQELRIVMLKMVSETPLQFGVAERLSRTFKVESMGLRVDDLKLLWADSVGTTYLIYRIPYVLIGLCIPDEEWRGNDTNLAHLKAVAQIKCDTAFAIQRVTRLSEAEILHLWTRFIKPKNDSIVTEHGLSLEITQSLCGSSDTSEGSDNNRSFEDSGSSDEEYSEDGASSKEEGSKTPQRMVNQSYSKALSSKEPVQRKKAINEEIVSLEKNQACSLVRLPARKKASHSLWMFRVKEKQDGSKRLVLSIVAVEDLHLEQLDVKTAFLYGDLDEDIYMTQLEGSDMAEFNNHKWVLIFVKDSWNKEPCKDVHQVAQPQVNPDSTIAQVEQITPFTYNGTGGPATLEQVASYIIGRKAYCDTGFKGKIVG
ncbi:retrovirus-related pol polyprotein from transposon TNT 1-94, partial [Tanacetum coccineum]